MEGDFGFACVGTLWRGGAVALCLMGEGMAPAQCSLIREG